VKLTDGLSSDQKKIIIVIFHGEGALDIVDENFLINRYNRYMLNSFENRELFDI
jgi:hypothetical protein